MKIKSLGKKEIENYEKIYKEIVTLYSSGTMTMKEIGEKFDITKQRVWQIITKMKKGQGDYYYEHRNK
jgi:DNA-directed RNA polymerase specialized sigma subunit